MKYIPRVLRYVRPYWLLAAGSGFVTLLSTLAGLAKPWPLKLLIDSVLAENPQPLPLVNLQVDRLQLLVLVVLAELALHLVTNALTVLVNYLETKLSQGIVLDLRSDL